MKGQDRIAQEIKDITDLIRRTKNETMRNILLEQKRKLLLDQAQAAREGKNERSTSRS